MPKKRTAEPDAVLRRLGGTMQLRKPPEHINLSDADAAAFVALLDDAPRIPRLIRAAKNFLRRVAKR